jgi:hypothetical protein
MKSEILNRMPGSTQVVAVEAPGRISNMPEDWVKLGPHQAGRPVDIWVAPLGSVSPGGWTDPLGQMPLWIARTLVASEPVEIEPLKPRDAARSETERLEFRQYGATLETFIRQATSLAAMPSGPMLEAVVQAFQAMVQVLSSVHAQNVHEFHRELGVPEKECSVCNAAEAADYRRRVLPMLDTVDMILSRDGAPVLTREQILNLMVEIRRSMARLENTLHQDSPWAINDATMHRMLAANRESPTTRSLASVARVHRAMVATEHERYGDR